MATVRMRDQSVIRLARNMELRVDDIAERGCVRAAIHQSGGWGIDVSKIILRNFFMVKRALKEKISSTRHEHCHVKGSYEAHDISAALKVLEIK
ncbi:hypothetical protein Pint_06852 [Pistacia integerrima]|uniref:Uncharacterized protein n=1 Tax=Pistacia integerrima TaxID=434235 RepID=A0ACC0XU77_9ROSI|nr:hypothetical protein Pint_06852 [Pistacia integerrima]